MSALSWSAICLVLCVTVLDHTAVSCACIASVVLFIVLRSPTAGELKDVPSNCIVETYITAVISLKIILCYIMSF